MTAPAGAAAHAPAVRQVFASRCRSSSRRGRSQCTCAAVAEPLPRLARAVLSQSDSSSMESSYNGGLFCIWPRFSSSAQATGFGRAAQAAQHVQRPLPAEVEMLAGGFTDGPVSTQSEQGQQLAVQWRYQGLRL